MLWNARKLNNKLHHLNALPLDGELDSAFITETWFKSQLNTSTATLRENGFDISHFNRDDKGGGGIAVIGVVLNFIAQRVIILIHLSVFMPQFQGNYQEKRNA